MDDNMSNRDNNQQNDQQMADSGMKNNIDNNTGDNGGSQSSDANDNVRNFTMDDKGRIRSDTQGTAAMATGPRTFVVLGWISAFLTAFVSPYFAIAGLVLGVLANRQSRGSGNAVIITNVILALVNIIWASFLIRAVRRMMFGY